jgi:LPS export ABC transporter permease LptG
MLPYTLPVACLTAGVVSVTVLARTGELTAIKASGISVRRTTVPLVAITAVVCGAFFLVQDRIAPTTNQKRLELKDQIADRSPRTYGLPPGGGWIFGADGTHLYHYGFFDDARVEFRDLSVLTLDRASFRFLDHRHADRATWNGASWTMKDVWHRNLPVAPGDRSTFEWSEEDTVDGLDPPGHFAASAESLDRRSRVADQMNVEELRARIRALAQSGYDTTRLEVAYHAKFAQPLSPLVMLLLGLPFAFRVGRRGSLYGVGVSILLVIVYWATLATFQALGLETILPPLLAAWAPNVLYGLLGSYLLLYVRT